MIPLLNVVNTTTRNKVQSQKVLFSCFPHNKPTFIHKSTRLLPKRDNQTYHASSKSDQPIEWFSTVAPGGGLKGLSKIRFSMLTVKNRRQLLNDFIGWRSVKKSGTVEEG
jgi:hypothetical protein